MKEKKNKKRTRATKPAVPPLAEPVPPEPEPESVKKIREEWHRLTKYPEYDKKLGEFLTAKPDNEERFLNAIRTIADFGALDESLAINFPYPFRNDFCRTAMLARNVCRNLKNIALHDNHDAIIVLAEIAVEFTETLTELLTKKTPAAVKMEALIKELNDRCASNITYESHAYILRVVAAGLPYWPMLRFRNAAGNAEEQFQLLADELKLGERCPLNVSKKANYNLDIPINSFVWKCLRHFQKVHSSIKYGLLAPRKEQRLKSFFGIENPQKTFEQAIASIVFQVPTVQTIKPMVTGMIPEKDIGIYKVSYYLPPLTKATAKDWTDKAIMPYVCSRFSDFSKVPEFAGLLNRSGVKTRGGQRREIRRDIFRSLTSLARK